MTWLPSFVKLFLLFVAGLVLSLGGGIAQLQFMGNYTMGTLLMTLSLMGWVIVVVSPLLMALKFFAQLDRKVE
ncbi:hypothetical protein [Hymenobacter sp. B1770]|uniref:hypothetical protein n=1 Tax=Hymenobacter sp. B1770 TaxID=1718788 RepID=UPI003CF4962E